MSGRPIINRLCRVLWCIARIVTYIAALPPKAESKNSVLSLILRFPFLACDLSAMQTITEIKLITLKYINMYLPFKKITVIILTALNRLFNLFFKLYDNSFFKPWNIWLRNTEGVSNLFLCILLITVHTKPHFHYLLFPRRKSLHKPQKQVSFVLLLLSPAHIVRITP